MSFEVTIASQGEHYIITLKNNFAETEAEIFSFGALLNQFSISRKGIKENVVWGYKNVAESKENITAGFQSAKLSPFVCRMKEGKYKFANEEHKINKFYLQSEAIHGLLYDAPFTIKGKGADATKAYVALEYDYNKTNEGFPFEYRINVTYSLENDNRLSIATRVANVGKIAMPLSDGWHPYFKLSETINDLQIQINSKQIVDFDDRLLPTGRVDAFKNYEYFDNLGETVFDNCFALNDFDKPACTIKDELKGLCLQIIADASYPYLQIYTPQNRRSIAIENLSSVPDAFNNGIGLITLQPEQSKTFTTTYRLVSLI